MSHFREVETIFTDKECLLEALKKCTWYPVGQRSGLHPEIIIETYDQPQPLYGFKGDVRKNKCHLIVRRNWLGSASNDLGFYLDPETGTYKLSVSDFDNGHTGYGKFGARWQKNLTKLYAFEVGKKQMKADGWAWKEVTDEAGQIKLVAEVEVNTAQPKTWDRRPARKKNW